MKALPKILLALTAVAALSVAYPAKANLITNGGFEDLPFLTGWNVSGQVGGSNIVHSGNFAAALIGGSIPHNVPTTPGPSYVVDFWLAATIVSPPGGQAAVNVLWG